MRYRGGRIDFVYGVDQPERLHSEPRAIRKGRRLRVMWRAYWSASSDGSAMVYLDGVMAASFRGPNMHDATPPYFKFGVYRPDGGRKAATVVFRNLALGATRADVE